MGIAPHYASALSKVLSGRPIEGRAFTVGRQTMFFSPEDAVRMTGAPVDPETLESDCETRFGCRKTITDRAFFGLLGIDHLESIDVSDYERATVIHDLNQPLPPELEGIAGLIVDGSTLDNVFNPATTLMNLSRMLAPGGLLFSINVGSNHYCPYTIPTPLWLLDYFVVNRYARASVYAVVHAETGLNVFTLDPATMPHGPRAWTDNFTCPQIVGLLAVAEKGADSTWAEMPIQHQYRSESQQRAWIDCLASVAAFDDPLPSSAAQAIPTPPGYRFVPGPTAPLTRMSISQRARRKAGLVLRALRA